MRDFINYSRPTDQDLDQLPNREKIINKDDLLNLKIALATCGDVLEFVEDIHIFNSSR